MHKTYYMIGMALFIILLGGCRGIEQFSPEQVMQNALATEADELSYYGEQTMTITDPDDTFTMEVKEWRSGEKSLEEVEADNEVMVTLMDGKSISIYDQTENTVTHTEFDNVDELNFNAKDQLEDILDVVGDTHEIENKGEEQIAGRTTIHLVAEKKSDEKTLLGTHEMWVDKENWLVLKTISQTGDTKVTMEYLKIKLDANMDDSVFALDIPEDATIETFDDEIAEEVDITLEEALDKLGSPYLYFPEEAKLTIDSVSYMEIDGEMPLKSVDIEYNKEGLPFLTLSIYLDNDETIDSTEQEDDLTELISIRDSEAEFFEIDDVRLLSWSEEGLNYSVSMIQPNYPMDDIIELVENMKIIKK